MTKRVSIMRTRHVLLAAVAVVVTVAIVFWRNDSFERRATSLLLVSGASLIAWWTTDRQLHRQLFVAWVVLLLVLLGVAVWGFGIRPI